MFFSLFVWQGQRVLVPVQVVAVERVQLPNAHTNRRVKYGASHFLLVDWLDKRRKGHRRGDPNTSSWGKYRRGPW
jgi:hypothetical protein